MGIIKTHWLLGLFIFQTLSLSVMAEKVDRVVYLDLRHLLNADYGDSLTVCDTWDALHTVSTLQGIVNRNKPQFYINYSVCGQRDIDTYWWQKYRQQGLWLANADSVGCPSVEDAVRIFNKDVRGAVVYDPNVASTSNVASAIAGIEDLVAVRYDKRPESLYSRLCTNGGPLTVKVWLVNDDGSPMFTGKGLLPNCTRASSGSQKCDPYLWFIEKYMKTGRCKGRYAGYYLDQRWRDMPTRTSKNHHQLTNHDFFVSRRGFFFDLSPWDDEAATDDPTQATGTDLNTLKELLAEAQRLGNGRKMCYIGGFPAWAFKYTRHAGGRHEDVATEWQFSELISHYNAFKDADAIGYGALANASFWQHFPLNRKYKQPLVTRDKLKQRGLINADGRVNTEKNYVVIYMGDYDASSWVSQRTADIWDAKERGRLPTMWCISPVLSERIPHAMHYIRQTATAHDYFAAADNGAGYMMPGVAEEQQRTDGIDHIKAWQKHCRKYYKKWELTITGFIIDGNGPAMGKRSLDAYARFSPNGIVPQKCDAASLHGSMPVLRSDWDLVSNNPREAALVMYDRIKSRTIPFHWFRCILKSPTWYEQVCTEAKMVDSSIELVDAPTFFELLRIWLKEHHQTP